MDKTGTRPADPRARLDDAVVALVAEEGVAGISVRKVAHRAGVSIGMVQHHHPTKQALVAAAWDAVGARFAERARSATDGLAPAPALRELCRQLLPLDATRAAESRVWLAFVAAAAVDAELAARHAAGWAELEELLASLLAGRGTPGDDDRAAAGLLLATLDGLASGGVTEPARLPPARLEALLDGALAAAGVPKR